MQVASSIQSSARSRISEDGRVLVVDRFDLDAGGQSVFGLEDFCALLGMRPANKYETSWERVARAVHDHVPGSRRRQTFRELAGVLLLTYALRNSDCHAKNIALLYGSREDVRLAPIYDMVTTVVYAGYEKSPPGLSWMGKRTWQGGKSLQKFITQTFGVPVREQSVLIEQISDAVAEVAPLVAQAIRHVPGFGDVGKRMLMAWQEGVSGLRSKYAYAMTEWRGGDAFKEFSPPVARAATVEVIGRSELLGRRSRTRSSRSGKASRKKKGPSF